MQQDQPPGEQPAGLVHWRPTDRWKPGRTGTASGGRGVECEGTGEVGFCKISYVLQEKLCADLAREVGVSVPPVKLGTLEGHQGLVAVSMAHGKESLDLPMLQQRDPQLFNSQPVQEAIRAASGLLALYAWVKGSDLKDDHLVVAEDGEGGYSVAGIDFAYAMQWGGPQDAVEGAGPPALTQNPDRDVLQAIVERIEACTDERIASIVNSLPDDVLSLSQKAAMIEVLKTRRDRIRDALRQKGWLP